MPVGPRAADVPRIRLALAAFRVSAIVTGVFLLLLVVMMVLRYVYLVDIEYTDAYGLQLTPKELIDGRGGVNLSIVILTTHGWLYVVYLACDFLLWRLTRWSFGRFLFIASVPADQTKRKPNARIFISSGRGAALSAGHGGFGQA